MKIRYLSSAAAVLALALSQTSGAGILTLNGSGQGTIGSVSINANGDMTVTTTSTSSTPPAPGVPVCSLGASATSIVPGQSSTLTANCTNNPTAYTWTASSGAPAAPTGQSGTVAFPSAGSFTYSVLAGNGANSNPVTITVSASVTTPPVAGNCPALPAGVTVTNYTATWTPQYGFHGRGYGFGHNEIAAIRFVADDPNPNRSGIISWVPDNNYANVSTVVNISQCPGDFSQSSYLNSLYCSGSAGANGYNTLYYTQSASGGCSLTPGQTYYFNIRNGISSGSFASPTISDTCPAGTVCGAKVEFR